MKNSPNFIKKLKDAGLGIIAKTKSGFNLTKKTIEQNFLNDALKKRFNLENPHRFLIYESEEKLGLLQKLTPLYAKRYLEDEIFVFFGHLMEEDIKESYLLKDLSDEALYKVKEIAYVKVSVTYENKAYDVDGTAVSGQIL